MKKLTFIVLVWLIGLSCMAQDSTRQNTLSLTFGPGYIARQDLIFSPFIHSDLTFINLGLEYKREAKMFQIARLRFASFNPMVAKPYEFTIDGKTEQAYPHTFTIVDVDYLLGKKINETEKSNLTVGGLLTVDVQAMNYVYGRISSLGYYSAFGLGVFGRKEYTINEKSALSITIQLPLVAWLARSPYLVNDDEFIENISSHSGFKTFMAFIGDGQFATLNRLQTFDIEAKYTYNLNNRWKVGAAYLFEFIHSSRPRNLLSYRNSLNLSANYRF